MRAGRRLALLILSPLLALAAHFSLGGAALGDGATGPAGAAHGPADVTAGASRGTTLQETPTLPPPSSRLPPATTPSEVDRNVVRLDWTEIPPDSGTGRRVVYSKNLQRVWLIGEDGTLYNTHRVSGRMDQPDPGVYAVFSRSVTTCSRLHSDICMRWMVRFAHTKRTGDNIGFHEIPRRDGVALQTEEKLGAPLSGGCVRQGTDDAILMWDWAQLGTVVVVVL